TDWLALARVDLAYQLTYPASVSMLGLPLAEGLHRQTLRAPEGLPRAEIQRAYADLMAVCVRQGKSEEAAAVFGESLSVGRPAPQGLCWCLSGMENRLARAGQEAEFRVFCEEAKTLLSRTGVQLSLNQW